ncbi:hypothetical protein JG687_00007346 [Phytophthora cactorum]|uniref:Tetratricopeptide-like helical domain n=1 Tax=Phytophthora cactorum TaxID=29920 RepID=A0A329RX95_9STRA|nr:hypothetical protein Pcac1_g1171 [Phytophthora cactorum]KAG2808091.1 hypothetical protein PC112_g17114 [Phytophthora cactorum]KAG2814697.1 hypothetical protein PC111_g13865 [Phytophthora cactorum]KAG2852910.1 hypothetical protein PC113_g14621 [Phytophthora cactorum]KAG2892893.1 hypothetical protein PC114_g16459 [Phytophthora cactorum]
MLGRGQCVALISVASTLIYASPLLLTRTSGNWDFWYIWDDRTNFVENEMLHCSWSFETLFNMLTMVRLNVYEPLGWLLKYVIVQTVGLDAWWARMVSIVIHFAAGFVLAKVSALVLDIDYMMTELKPLQIHQSRLHFNACCVSAVAYMVHPLHVEVIAWPSAQPYTLAALCSCWALFVHVKNIHQNLSNILEGKSGKYAGSDGDLSLNVLSGDGAISSSLSSSGLYLCALLSKSASLLLPAGFFLMDVWVYLQLSPQQQTVNMKQIRLYAAKMAPSIAILLVFASVTAISNSQGGVPDVVSLSINERVLKTLNSPLWIVRSLVWPSRLRPHYRIQPGDLSLSNPECLLSSATTIFTLVLTIWNSCHRGVSKHSIAVAFFICMVMPVSGLIQHGIITAAANRYAYLPTIIIVPYGGWVVACCLFQESNSQQESDRLTAPAWDTPEREISHNSRRSKQLKEIKSSTQIHTSKSHVWGVYVLVVGTLLSISTDLLGQWRNEDSLFQYSLRVDPADWKILGQRSEYLLHAGRCTPDDTECRQLWILAHEFSPRGTLKSQLYRLHLLVALGRVDHACDGYLKLLKHHPGNSSVHNNAAVCFAFRGMMTEARREFSRALLYPGIAETLAAHARNSREFDQWEAKSRHHGLEESSGFGGAMTY